VNQANDVIVGCPQFAVNCNKDVVFNNKRGLDSKKYFELNGLCHHLSYVLSDEELLRKISTWGMRKQFDRDKWYEKKWLRWNEKTTDLHPIEPSAWKCAIRRTFDLPEILKNFECPDVFPYRWSARDVINDFSMFFQKSV